MRRGALDALVLLVIGGAGIVGALCWPDYTMFAVSGSVALIVLFVVLRC
jgi:hypothetical protein